MIREIAGRHNHAVKLARKLQKKKWRRERGLIVCEGMDLLEAALAAQAEIIEVLVRKELFAALPHALRARAEAGMEQSQSARVPNIGLCSQETLDYASSLGGSADVVFLCRKPGWHLSSLPARGGIVFYLDGLGDPGNVGTLCRSALAFGLQGVICSPGTADAFGPKALRAGMGAQFLLPVVSEVMPSDLKAYLERIAEEGSLRCSVVVADARGDVELASAAELFAQGGLVVVVLGEEREGPAHPWPEAKRVSIPQVSFDSLNVAMAGTVFAYEAAKARVSRKESHGSGQGRPAHGSDQLADRP